MSAVRADLPRCAREVLLWRRTGNLPDDAFLRQVGDAFSGITDDHLQQAEDLVILLALEAVASQDS